jgi:hypothetical protein
MMNDRRKAENPMPTKRKNKKTSRKPKTVRKVARKRKHATAAAKRPRAAKASAKRKAVGKRKSQSGKAEVVDRVVFEPKGLGARSAGQAGDLQGLSEVEAAESESVSELLEEGNAFEAEVLSGVEGAPDADEREVTTHEVPEDDVPPEYREKE